MSIKHICGEPGGVCTSPGCAACRTFLPVMPRLELRLEAFHVICRDCGNRDVCFARDPERTHLGLRAVCPQCGLWEYVE